MSHRIGTPERARMGDEVWLIIAVGFLCLAPITTLFAFGSGFDFDPDDYPGSYYLEQIPRRQAVMAITMAVPAVSALAAAIGAVRQPRRWQKTCAAAVLFVLALLDLWICWVLGLDAVESAKRYSEMF